MGFYQKFIFKLNMINFSMWTKVKLSWIKCDVTQLWRHQAIKQVNYMVLWTVHSSFHKNYKNRPRDARVIVENKWFLFYGTRCYEKEVKMTKKSSTCLTTSFLQSETLSTAHRTPGCIYITLNCGAATFKRQGAKKFRGVSPCCIYFRKVP